MAEEKISRLLGLANRKHRVAPLTDEQLTSLQVAVTIEVQGGQRNVAYHRALDHEKCRWRDIVQRHLVGRVIFGATIGAGIGGPSGEAAETYMYGAFHTWPLYDPQRYTPRESTELVFTLLYGVAALLRCGSLPNEVTLSSLIRKSRNAGRYVIMWQKVCDLPTIPAPFDDIAKDVTLEPNVIARYIDLNDYCCTGATFGDLKFDIPNRTVDTNIPIAVDILLTLAWVLLSDSISTYQCGILCGAFPTLVNGTNPRTERFNRLTVRIANEIGITSGLSVNPVALQYAWDGMKQLLALPDGARIAGIRAGLIGRSVGSKWMEVMGNRMAFHALTSLILIATAIQRFPTAGWTNFLDLHQDVYTQENTGIQMSKLLEYIPMIDSVRILVNLPFTAQDYLNGTDDEKVKYLLITFQAIRPTKMYGDWLKQGNLVLDLMEQALLDPFMMYKNEQGRSREYADMAYFSLLLLRDIAKQGTLQNFTNIYQVAALRPQEVEKIVNEYGKIIRLLPGSMGLLELATSDLSPIVQAIVDPYSEVIDPKLMVPVIEGAKAVLEGMTQTGASMVPGQRTTLAPLPPPGPSHVHREGRTGISAPVTAPRQTGPLQLPDHTDGSASYT